MGEKGEEVVVVLGRGGGEELEHEHGGAHVLDSAEKQRGEEDVEKSGVCSDIEKRLAEDAALVGMKPTDLKDLIDSQVGQQLDLQRLRREAVPECKGVLCIHPIKGVGLVADRALCRGEEIVMDTTYFATDLNCGETRSFDDEDLLLGKFGKWSFEQATLYFKMRYHHIADASTPMTSLRSSLGLRTVNPLRKAQLKLAVTGVWISNINHACHPNAHVWVDPIRKGVGVTAVANIGPGEEVTIAYLDMSLPISKRVKVADQALQFSCCCELCYPAKSLPRKRAEDEEKYGELEKWTGEMRKWSGLPNLHQIKTSPEALLNNFYHARKFFRGEEIWDQRVAGCFEYGFCVVAYHGDQGRAIQFAKIAHRLRLILEGPNSHDVKILEKLKNDPKGWKQLGSESTWTAPPDRAVPFEKLAAEEFWAKLFMVGDENSGYDWADIKTMETEATETANPEIAETVNPGAIETAEPVTETAKEDIVIQETDTVANVPSQHVAPDTGLHQPKQTCALHETTTAAQDHSHPSPLLFQNEYPTAPLAENAAYLALYHARDISYDTAVFDSSSDDDQAQQSSSDSDDQVLFLAPRRAVQVTTAFTSDGKLVVSGPGMRREVSYKKEQEAEQDEEQVIPTAPPPFTRQDIITLFSVPLPQFELLVIAEQRLDAFTLRRHSFSDMPSLDTENQGGFPDQIMGASHENCERNNLCWKCKRLLDWKVLVAPWYEEGVGGVFLRF